MNKIIKRASITFGIIVALFVIVFGSYSIYCWSTYIDETITEGEAYGFNIGDTKLEVFARAKNGYLNKTVFILHPLDKNDFGPHKQMSFEDEYFKLIEDRDKWTFYFDKRFFNFLKLTFEHEKLTGIHRHRKNFEMP